MHCRNKQHSDSQCQLRQTGFTLIELAVVIIIISIIAAIASAKVSSSASLTVGHQAELAANHIRQAQSLAVAWGCKMKVNIATSSYNVTALDNSYVATAKASLCGDGATIVTNPANRQAFSINLINSVQFAAAGNIYFDVQGRLTDAAGTPSTVASSFTMTGDGISYQISVSPVSGFVTLTKL